MKTKKLLLIFNPKSGKSQIKSELWNIVDIFTKGGYEVTVYPTQKRYDAHDVIIKKSERFDTVVVCGGDGTLSEAVQGLTALPPEKRVTLGYLPGGSTNDFGNSLHIPTELAEAAKCIVKGEPMNCDCGVFNGKPYLYICAFGAFTDVPYETPQKIKNQLGHAAYLLEALKRFNTYTYYHLKVQSEEMKIEDDFILGLVSNTTSIGGMKNRSEYAPLLNDGLFECVLIKNPSSPAELNNILTALVTQNFDCPSLIKFTTKKVTMISNEPIKWTTDGEDGGEHTSVTVEVIHNAYRIIVDNKYESKENMLF